MSFSRSAGGALLSGNLYEIVTLKILEALGKGVVPWKRPWSQSVQLPCNALTNKPYRGVNIMLLGMSPWADNRWLTHRQAQGVGGKVIKGEKASLVVFWKYSEPQNDEEERRPPVLRYYNVFNVEQVEGLEIAPLPTPVTLPDDARYQRAEVLATSMINPPTYEERGKDAWYCPARDLIRPPKRRSFDTIDSYFAVRYHELAHSTGHASRLNRRGVVEAVNFGSELYSKEELVAELTSSFCCATVGLDNSLIQTSASYIESWLKVLRFDPKMVVFAAAQAQKATDYIKGVNYDPL